MQARQKVADAQVSKDHEQKTYHRKVGGASSGPAARDTRMKKRRVRQPGYKCAGFFRIKSPWASPGLVGPDSSRDKKHREAGKSEACSFVHQAVERFEARQALAKLFSPES